MGETTTTTERPPIYHVRMSRKHGRDGTPPTQEAVANELAIHPITLLKLERYGRIVPGRRLATKLAAFLTKVTGNTVTPGEVIDDYARHQETR